MGNGSKEEEKIDLQTKPRMSDKPRLDKKGHTIKENVQIQCFSFNVQNQSQDYSKVLRDPFHGAPVIIKDTPC